LYIISLEPKSKLNLRYALAHNNQLAKIAGNMCARLRFFAIRLLGLLSGFLLVGLFSSSADAIRITLTKPFQTFVESEEVETDDFLLGDLLKISGKEQGQNRDLLWTEIKRRKESGDDGSEAGRQRLLRREDLRGSWMPSGRNWMPRRKKKVDAELKELDAELLGGELQEAVVYPKGVAHPEKINGVMRQMGGASKTLVSDKMDSQSHRTDF
jgi:hypothetical protein